MYRNQRPIFTPLFLTPIIRTLKTEEGEFPKIRRGGGGGARSLNFFWRGGRSLKGGDIPRDLAPGRAKLLGISPLVDGGWIPGGGGRNPCDNRTSALYPEYATSIIQLSWLDSETNHRRTKELCTWFCSVNLTVLLSLADHGLLLTQNPLWAIYRRKILCARFKSLPCFCAVFWCNIDHVLCETIWNILR